MSTKDTYARGMDMHLRHEKVGEPNTYAPQVSALLLFTPIGEHNEDAPADWTEAFPLEPPAGATKLLIQALTQNVRFTLDGTEPTSSVGFQLKAGDAPTQIPVVAGTVITVIEEAATAEVQYQWGS